MSAMTSFNRFRTVCYACLASLLFAGVAGAFAVGCRPVDEPAQAPRTGSLNCHIYIPWLPPTVVRWAPVLSQACARHRVDAELLAVVMVVESGGSPTAISPAGAVGLMQVMPATGKDIARLRGIKGYHEGWLTDPNTNIDFGAWYLAKQLANFGGPDPAYSVELAAAAYNGGPGRLRRHLRGQADLSNETSRYKRWVRGMWLERRHADSPTYRAWSRAGGRRLVARAAAE